MRYFIGYLIEGEAAAWHVNVAKNISDRFNTWKIYEKLPPHITIFYPFSTENIEPVENLLKEWTQSKKVPENFIISDFDHFEDKVVFAKVGIEQSVGWTVEELRRSLKLISGMPSEDFPIWHPHATLANRQSPEKINQIWGYVLTLKKPNFIIPFDNITIFRFEGDRKWVIEKIFKFN